MLSTASRPWLRCRTAIGRQTPLSERRARKPQTETLGQRPQTRWVPLHGRLPLTLLQHRSWARTDHEDASWSTEAGTVESLSARRRSTFTIMINSRPPDPAPEGRSAGCRAPPRRSPQQSRRSASMRQDSNRATSSLRASIRCRCWTRGVAPTRIAPMNHHGPGGGRRPGTTGT